MISPSHIVDRHSRLPKQEERVALSKKPVQVSVWRVSPLSSPSSTPSPSHSIRAPSPGNYPSMLYPCRPRHIPPPLCPHRYISMRSNGPNSTPSVPTTARHSPPSISSSDKKRPLALGESLTSQKCSRHDASRRDRSDSDDWQEFLSSLIPSHDRDSKSDNNWHGELLSADELREIQWQEEI